MRYGGRRYYFICPKLGIPCEVLPSVGGGRRVQRDVKAVHSDVTALLSAGLLNRTKTGGIEFPYQAIKVEFLLQAA